MPWLNSPVFGFILVLSAGSAPPAMGGALSRASRAVRAGPPPSEFPAPPRVPTRAAPAAVSEMEQARSIEATLNQATISSSTVISHGAAPTGMAQRNALVGELDPLEL